MASSTSPIVFVELLDAEEKARQSYQQAGKYDCFYGTGQIRGTDLVEFDVSLTKDGIAVILHDDTLDRTTNLVGPIRQVLYKDLQKCNCAAKFHSENSVDGSAQIQSMPTLDQMVKWAKAEGQKMLFDVKDTDSCFGNRIACFWAYLFFFFILCINYAVTSTIVDQLECTSIRQMEDSALLNAIAWWFLRKRRSYVRPAHYQGAFQRNSFETFWRYYRSPDERDLVRFLRLSKAEFDEIRCLLEHCPTHLRPIQDMEKLAIFLRFIAFGPTYCAVAHLFAIGDSTVYDICKEVFQAIVTVMQAEFMPPPNRQTWESRFLQLQEVYSIVLLAIADAESRFIAVDVGPQEEIATLLYGSQARLGHFSNHQKPISRRVKRVCCRMFFWAMEDSDSLILPEIAQLYATAAVILHNYLKTLINDDDGINIRFPDDRRLLVDQRAPEAGRLILKLEELFEQYQLYDVGIVCSFWPTVVYRIKHHCPRILTGITWRRGFFSSVDIQRKTRRFNSLPLHYLSIIFDVLYVWSIKSWLPAFLGVDLVLTERNEISENFVRQQEQSGRKVCAWTVNDLNEMVWMRKR
uniref:GP-PDE domain-containing protein n=1 Tax=Ditylenchus dipsaci TaxID=166011 RepID=A0A915DKP4_9BILA